MGAATRSRATTSTHVHDRPGSASPRRLPEHFDQSRDTGTFNGVWTKQISGDFDYNPDAAMPSSGSWDDFIAAFFGPHDGNEPTVKDLSYEFDYYSCGYHDPGGVPAGTVL